MPGAVGKTLGWTVDIVAGHLRAVLAAAEIRCGGDLEDVAEVFALRSPRERRWVDFTALAVKRSEAPLVGLRRGFIHGQWLSTGDQGSAKKQRSSAGVTDAAMDEMKASHGVSSFDAGDVWKS